MRIVRSSREQIADAVFPVRDRVSPQQKGLDAINSCIPASVNRSPPLMIHDLDIYRSAWILIPEGCRLLPSSPVYAHSITDTLVKALNSVDMC